jgi:hypothetical protein
MVGIHVKRGGDGGAWPSLQHKESRKQWQFGQLSVLLSAC